MNEILFFLISGSGEVRVSPFRTLPAPVPTAAKSRLYSAKRSERDLGESIVASAVKSSTPSNPNSDAVAKLCSRSSHNIQGPPLSDETREIVTHDFIAHQFFRFSL